MEVVELIVRYAVLPILSVLCTVAWSLYKKHEMRLDILESKHNDLEKAVIEIRTEFRYISRDIKEIKDLLRNLNSTSD